MSNSKDPVLFSDIGLSSPILKVLDEIGYETPSPIQEACIPPILEGRDIIGQAQTGTGKTAAFALPLLDRIDVKQNVPQLLVLAPTRELAIQVAEAVQTYSRHINGLRVLPIYGGQAYGIQLKPLRRGVHAVVGTPGRVMDHIKKGTLKLDGLKALVLDEADEMLRMGFIDDVEWVMDKLPKERQIALFSATMPEAIKRVAKRFLQDPEFIKIKSKTTTATTIRQRYWQVSGVNKLDALTRILEVESFEAMLIFVRTKTLTVELADKLSARGFAAEAINGDIQQKNRERIIDQLKKGRIDILIATDVAARGLDVPRISHVINYDIPHDPESYVHRIGRTGRAGRTGDAILFVAPREKRMLHLIEKVSGHRIEPMQLPSPKLINETRIKSFKQKISDTLANQNLDLYQKVIAEFHDETNTDPSLIAAALAKIAQGDKPLFISEKEPRPQNKKRRERDFDERPARGRSKREDGRRDNSRRDSPRRESTHSESARRDSSPRDSFNKERSPRSDPHQRVERPAQTKPDRLKEFPDMDMNRYRIEVGRSDDVAPGNIVGAIANEAEIESCYIGTIEIHDSYSTVDLPEGMPGEVLRILKKARVCGKKLEISEIRGKRNGSEKPSRPPPGGKNTRGKLSTKKPSRKPADKR